MWMWNMAWKNLDRNRSRTIITISAIFFAVVLSVATSSLRAGIFDQLVDNITRSYTGKIQIHSRGYWDEPSLDKTFLRDSMLEKRLKTDHKMRSVLPRLESFVLVATERSTKGAQLIGFDPAAEDRMSRIRSQLVAGQFPDSGSKGLLLAEGLLHRLGAEVGDTMVLLSQGYRGIMAAGKYPVLGVLHFGSPEWNNHLLFIPLIWMQDFLLAEGRLTAYVLDPSENKSLRLLTDSIRTGLGRDLEVMAWTEMMPDIEQHIRTDTQNMRIVQWVLYLLVGFGIFGTLLMLFSERTHEFGMLLALGLQKTQLAMVLIWESMFVFGLGVSVGLLASAPLIGLLHRYPIRLSGSIAAAYERFGFEATFPAAIDPTIFWEQGVTVLIMGLLLSLYLLYRVFRLNPVKAMR